MIQFLLIIISVMATIALIVSITAFCVMAEMMMQKEKGTGATTLQCQDRLTSNSIPHRRRRVNAKS